MDIREKSGREAFIPLFENSEEIYRSIKKDNQIFGSFDLGFLDFYGNEMRGGNPLIAGQLNRILSNYGLRTAVPKDNSYGKIYGLIKKFYVIELNAIVVHHKVPFYKENNNLWKKLIELAKREKGEVRFPFIVQGFYTFPDLNEKEYGVKILPTPNFKIIEDERLSIKYNGKKFKSFDESGFPSLEELERNEGPLEFRTREDGLARIRLEVRGLSCSLSNLSDFPCEDPEVHNRMAFINETLPATGTWEKYSYK